MVETQTSKIQNNEKRRVVSLNETAYLRFRQALTTLRYKPGEYLNTAQVMEDLEMGRTPINQAIHKLAGEGLLQIIPRKGVMVSPLSIDDALKLIEVRLANELLCLQLVCKKITKQELDSLKVLHEKVIKASQEFNTLEMMILDRQFHERLSEISDNKWLADILSVIHAQAQRFWASTLSSESHMREVVDEHQAIISALEKRDLSEVEQAASHHILSFKQSLMQI
ncbi:GntR family transcriptional regulator [Acinetobacter sp. ANC 4558]|uniref:GntR family transcriptional regulator n=1 Tax=Acinetobacter sp. ANC 4558 TaxID=1977876 RepID=UPI000A348EED|nr:GntR family transcriptional regulator [Acinetobacter sp. ANC 4558]OTG87409.1 GntR family transcriptional regulator [Acinetobacter sp. ANC 4558]